MRVYVRVQGVPPMLLEGGREECRLGAPRRRARGVPFGGPAEEMPVVKGPEWCYEGRHTVGNALLPDDARRVDRSVVALADGADLQGRLDGLDTRGVRV
mmetsp:Transcript_3594/g.9342  ORF Transcript_3594/g.9342 Transcript_3594/m.9342 type:complete len:99 (-) Transcript_3594:1216-1512(-)